MLKFLKRKKSKGQTTLEYAVLIIIIIGALLAVQTYIKRGVQGRMKSATDDIGDQFSPGNTNVQKSMITNSRTSESFVGGSYKTTLLDNEITTELLNSQIMNIKLEFWGN